MIENKSPETLTGYRLQRLAHLHPQILFMNGVHLKQNK
jgi:hypothetical protein